MPEDAQFRVVSSVSVPQSVPLWSARRSSASHGVPVPDDPRAASQYPDAPPIQESSEPTAPFSGSYDMLVVRFSQLLKTPSQEELRDTSCYVAPYLPSSVYLPMRRLSIEEGLERRVGKLEDAHSEKHLFVTKLPRYMPKLAEEIHSYSVTGSPRFFHEPAHVRQFFLVKIPPLVYSDKNTWSYKAWPWCTWFNNVVCFEQRDNAEYQWGAVERILARHSTVCIFLHPARAGTRFVERLGPFILPPVVASLFNRSVLPHVDFDGFNARIQSNTNPSTRYVNYATIYSRAACLFLPSYIIIKSLGQGRYTFKSRFVNLLEQLPCPFPTDALAETSVEMSYDLTKGTCSEPHLISTYVQIPHTFYTLGRQSLKFYRRSSPLDVYPDVSTLVSMSSQEAQAAQSFFIQPDDLYQLS